MADPVPTNTNEITAPEVNADSNKSGTSTNKTKTYLWAAFGIACVLALVLPAAWVVYNNSQGADTPSIAEPTPVQPQKPATGGEDASDEDAEGAEPDDGVATELGEDLEMWDYSSAGRNVFKSTVPVRLVPNVSSDKDSDEIEKDDIVLKSIGKNADDEYVAVFTVKGKQYDEVGVGEQIGSTGWYVKTITATSVTLSQTSGSVDKSLDEDTSGK